MKRILMVNSDLLLSAGVESLLSNEIDFGLRRIILDHEINLSDELNRFQPDTVIMDESLMMSEPSALMGLLKNRPDMRVIVLQVRENQLQIYKRHDVPISCVEDLVAVVRGS